MAATPSAPRPCGTCGAVPGMPCQAGSGTVLRGFHACRDTSVPVTADSMLRAMLAQD